MNLLEERIAGRKALGAYLDLVQPIRRADYESRDVLIQVLYARLEQHETSGLRQKGVDGWTPAT